MNTSRRDLLKFIISSSLFSLITTPSGAKAGVETKNSPKESKGIITKQEGVPKCSLFEMFTGKANSVIFFSRYEAEQLGDSSVQSYHLLLGLVREDRPIITHFLPGNPLLLELLDLVRRKVQDMVGTRPMSKDWDYIPLSLEAQRILRSSVEIARVLRKPVVETKYLLVGIMWEEQSVAAQILSELGLDLSRIYNELNLPATIPELILQLKAQEAEKPLSPLATEEGIKFLNSLRLTLE